MFEQTAVAAKDLLERGDQLRGGDGIFRADEWWRRERNGEVAGNTPINPACEPRTTRAHDAVRQKRQSCPHQPQGQQQAARVLLTVNTVAHYRHERVLSACLLLIYTIEYIERDAARVVAVGT